MPLRRLGRLSVMTTRGPRRSLSTHGSRSIIVRNLVHWCLSGVASFARLLAPRTASARRTVGHGVHCGFAHQLVALFAEGGDDEHGDVLCGSALPDQRTTTGGAMTETFAHSASDFSRNSGLSQPTIDLMALESMAASALDPAVYAYISGGAGDSVAANMAAWGALRLRPRML